MVDRHTADDLGFVAQIVADQYGVLPRIFDKLQLYPFDWRGIYRIALAGYPAQHCVLRLSQGNEFHDSFFHTGQLLLLLEKQGYPAPRVRLTSRGATVGSVGDWHMLMLTYIEGNRATPDPDTLGLQAEVTAQLHSLPPAVDMRDSRWRLDAVVGRLARDLVQAGDRLPAEMRAMNVAMLSNLENLQAQMDLPICLIHGDCWYMNAIRDQQHVTLIDWDQAGRGPAVLDLAYLLLTSHYDLSAPLEVQPNKSLISAIIHGYCSRRRVTDRERAVLFDAIRLVIAFAVGQYYAEHNAIVADDFIARKLQARFEATREIADIAAQCLPCL